MRPTRLAAFSWLLWAHLGCGVMSDFAPGVFTSDNFNRADSSSTLGSMTNAALGGYPKGLLLTGTWGIEDNQAYTTAFGPGSQSIVLVETSTRSCHVQITMKGDPSTYLGGIGFRSEDIRNGWAVISDGPNITSWGRSYHLVKSVNGTPTPLESGSVIPASGDVLRVEFTEEFIAVKINDTQILTRTDSAFSENTKLGFFISFSTSGRLDNFKIENCQ